MPLPLFVAALSLALGIGAPAPAPAIAAPLLAQDDRLEEDFGDPPPPPPPLDAAEGEPPLDPVGDAPALPPPLVEDTPDAPSPDDDEGNEEREADDGGDGESSVLLTRVLQYGAGVGTVALCGALGVGAGCCGVTCLTAALQPLLFSMPLLTPCLSALFSTALGAGAGAAAGAVEVLVGNTFGDEEGAFLWPTLAASGTGAGLLALAGGATVLSTLLSPAFNAPQPGNLQFNTPVTCLFSSATLLLCGACCVSAPLAGVLTYGAIATPKAPAEEAAALSSAPRGPTLASTASAMAF